MSHVQYLQFVIQIFFLEKDKDETQRSKTQFRAKTTQHINFITT